MAEPIDELVQRWKQNPSPATTIALCDALRVNPRAPLVQQVGEFATQRHGTDVPVLVAVARMYMEAHRFGDAQAVLVAAGKQAPRDGNIYRWLGEVLLRRGDAERAEKVLERAIQLGARDPDAQLWMERARVFRPMQAKAGTRAVATEVAHATAKPVRPPFDSMSDSTTAVHVRPPGAEDDDDGDEEPTRMGRQPPAAGKAPSVRPPKPLPAAGTPAPEPLMAAKAQPLFPRDVETAARSFETPGLAFDQSAATAVRAPSPDASGESATAVRAPNPSASGEIEISVQAAIPAAPPAPRRPAFDNLPVPAPSNGASARGAAHRPAESPMMVPHPRDVLDALSLAGVFEPPTERTGGAAMWTAANQGPKRKGMPVLIAGMVVFLAASVGVYFFFRDKRNKEHAAAEAILANVETQLHAGKLDAIPDMEQQLTQAFNLESRSPRAALDWARERVVVGLVKGGADVAFEGAMARAKEVEVPEEKYAFARVASFLFQNDTAGAAAVLPRWDGPAGIDPWYELVAGATLERAGDSRARERYATAAKLDADMVLAQVAQARATAIEGDSAEAMRLAQALRKSLPDRAEPVALVALAWGRDPNREGIAAPPEVAELPKRIEELPAGLRFVPHAIAALLALDKHAFDDARAAVQRGLLVADSPGAAVWLGTIALPLGDEGLARKGALAALQLSAVYEPARALAARVALLGDRLDEALKATEDLDPTSPEVAVVRAAAAYERVDADGVGRALEALPTEVRKQPYLTALELTDDALAGKLVLDGGKLMIMAGDDAPWSDLLAMDLALDGGDLATADKIADGWSKAGAPSSLRALRLSRLARYENRIDQADTLSQQAMEHGTVTPRVLWERASVLVAKNRSGEVGPMLARYPLVLGPLATWLSAFAAASAGNVEAAKGKTASAEPPPATAPLPARVIVAAAFGAMKDKRRGPEYVHDVLATGCLDPDLVAAALALGFHKVDHGRRRPTYEQ
ncbi:MAG TPA: tetratricopeptide repeat protein [Polyangiaceae bacterium]|nr:tetratricopeptide repeat protein [Polyangiaceae bacterium]